MKFGSLSFMNFQGEGEKVVGTLCDLNVALRTLSYIPAAGFSTVYDVGSSKWSPPHRNESIHIRVHDIAALGANQSSTVEDWVPVTVRPVASTPKLTLIMPPNTDSAVNLVLSSGSSEIRLFKYSLLRRCNN